MICISDYLMIRKSAFNISDSLLLSDESFVEMSLKNQIKQIWSTPGFKEAIAIASIELYKSCANIEKKNSKAIKDIHNSVIKYYIRMCTRSTPFGLFSGFSITKFGFNTKSNNQKFNLKPIYKISEEWLESLISQVLYTTNMIKYLSFKCNKNIDIKKKTISNYFVPGEKKRNTSIHINNNTLNNFILEYLNEERSFNELFYTLKSNKINITENILMNYLKDMVKKGFIITELQKSNFNNINIEKLKYLLRKSETPEVYLNVLNDLLSIIEKQSFNVNEYIKIVEESQQLIPKILPLQVDSILNTDVNLNSSIKKEIKEIAEVYYFLNNHWEVSNNYNKDFMEKYGVNVGVNIKNLAYKTKHLGVENNRSIKRRNNLLTDLAFSINREREESVDISDFYNIKNINYPSPASFDLYFKIYEDETGNRTIFPSGNIITNESHKTFGRFLKYFKELNEDLCIDKKTILDTIFPNNIKYGVSFKPIDFKALNVTKTPKMSPEKLYFNSFENNNKLDNISVYCNEKGEINIYDTTEKKKVHLLTNNMLNYNSSAPSICRFLLDSSENNYVKCYPINNENLENFAYFPRITYKNIVLRLKKWKFKSEKNSYRKIIEAYKYGFMDRFVTLVQFDNFILLDLEADYSKIILKKELTGKVEYIEFEEANHLVKNKSKYGEYEFVVPVNIVDEDKNKESEINLFNEYKDYENRVLTINDGLLYLKIYFISGCSDELLTELQMYFNKKKISNYFFIQYHDPLPHIRLRIISSSEKIMENLKIITYLNQLDYVKTIEIVDYEREIERYGGINKIETAEEIFKKDSKNALQLIKEKNKEQLAFAVGLNYIISFYEKYKVNEIYNLLETKLNKKDFEFYRQWIKNNDEFRISKLLIDKIFGKSMIIEDIREFNKGLENKLQTPYFLNIVFSFIHMSYNRLGIDNQTEEYINKCIYIYLKEVYYKWKNLKK